MGESPTEPVPGARRRLLRITLLAVIGAAVVAFAADSLWRATVVPWVEAELGRASGHRISVGSVRLGWRALEARQVRVLGAAPFEASALARIGRVRIALGGRRGFGFWQPSEVVADGAELTYLRSGSLDNVRGAGPRRVHQASAGGRPRPGFRLRGARVEAFLRGGPFPVVVRVARLDASGEGAADFTARAVGVVADVQGRLSIGAAELTLGAEDGRGTVSANGIEAVVPGAGRLLGGLSLIGHAGPEEARVALTSAPGAPARVQASAELVDGGARIAVEARALPLTALRPFVDGWGIDPARAELDLSGELLAEPAGPSPAHVDLKVRALDVSHPRLDREPWTGLALTARAAGTVELGAGRVTVERGQLDLLGLSLALKGSAEVEGRGVRGRWQVETTAPLPCASLLDSQAHPVQTVLAGLELEGQIGGGLAVTFDSASWERMALDLRIDPVCDVRREPSMLAAVADLLADAKAPGPGPDDLALGQYHPDFVPLKQMPPHLVAAFLTAEDGRFRAHPGFDLEMIRRALAHDLEAGTFAKGASTITQQLAKNLFLTQERTIARKLAEAVFAWRLHRLLPKERILELYLNIIELGPGIRGVKQAATAYFGKPLRALGPLESAHLAALTPNPLQLARRFRDGRVDDGWLHRLYDLLGMMRRSGRLSAAALATARGTRLSLRKI